MHFKILDSRKPVGITLEYTKTIHPYRTILFSLLDFEVRGSNPILGLKLYYKGLEIWNSDKFPRRLPLNFFGKQMSNFEPYK